MNPSSERFVMNLSQGYRVNSQIMLHADRNCSWNLPEQGCPELHPFGSTKLAARSLVSWIAHVISQLITSHSFKKRVLSRTMIQYHCLIRDSYHTGQSSRFSYFFCWLIAVSQQISAQISTAASSHHVDTVHISIRSRKQPILYGTIGSRWFWVAIDLPWCLPARHMLQLSHVGPPIERTSIAADIWMHLWVLLSFNDDVEGFQWISQFHINMLVWDVTTQSIVWWQVQQKVILLLIVNVAIFIVIPFLLIPKIS